MLGNSRQKLCALPIGKRQQGCMCRTDDKIQIAVPQSCVSFGDGKQQVDAGVETFRLKEAKLDGSDRGKIRIRDKIGNGDPYHSFSGPGRGASSQLCVLNDLNLWNELNCSNRSNGSNCFKSDFIIMKSMLLVLQRQGHEDMR